MVITGLEWPRFIFCLLVAGGINLFFLRRHLFSIFDPWIMVFINQTIILGALAYYTWAGEMLPEHFGYVLVGYLFLVLGMRVFCKKGFKPFRTRSLLSRTTLPIAIAILVCILIANNLTIYYRLGIPALRSGARTITLYSTLGRGGGVFLYLNQGLFILLPVLAMKALLSYKQKGLAYLTLFVVTMVLAASGGKSAFLGLFFAFGMSQFYLGRHKKAPVKIPKIAWVFLAILGVVIMYSFVNVVGAGYESSVLRAFIKRMINTAAGPYYYFIRKSYLWFSGLNLLSYHSSQITPYLGVRDLDAINLGVNLTLYSEGFGTPGFGPNPTLYVIGHIAWGYWGVFYCFILGMILSFVRYRVKAGFIVYVILNLWVDSLLVDGTLMPIYLVDVLALSPLLLVAVVIGGSSQKEASSSGFIADSETRKLAGVAH